MPPSAFALVDARTGRLLDSRRPDVRALPGSTVKPLLPVEGLFPCRRTLRIGSHRLDCTHPPARGPLSRAEAIALSCNSYFAAAALTIPPAVLRDAVRELEPELAVTGEQRQLQALGSWGLAATPLTLARAYRRLLHQQPPAGFTGKTGTTADAAWYAGWAPAASPRLVIAVLTGGRGASDARPEAEEILSRWS